MALQWGTMPWFAYNNEDGVRVGKRGNLKFCFAWNEL